MWERFTEKARRIIILAQEEATRLGHGYVGTEHILLGLIKGKPNVGEATLRGMGILLDVLRNNIETMVIRGDVAPSREKVFTPRTKTVLELSFDEARYWGHDYIGTEHILLGLLREGEGVAARILIQLGVNLEKARKQVAHLLGTEPITVPYRGATGKTGHQESGRVSVNVSFELLTNFNIPAHDALKFAHDEAAQHGHSYVDTEHLLLGLLREKNTATQILESLGFDIEALRKNVEDMMAKAHTAPHVGAKVYTQRLQVVIADTIAEAKHKWNRTLVGPEHLLIALLKEGGGLAARVLSQNKLDEEKLRAQTAQILGVEQPKVSKRPERLSPQEIRTLLKSVLSQEIQDVMNEIEKIEPQIKEALEKKNYEKAAQLRAEEVELLKNLQFLKAKAQEHQVIRMELHEEAAASKEAFICPHCGKDIHKPPQETK